MNLEDYQPYWSAAGPVMQRKLQEVVERLAPRLPTGLHVSPVRLDENRDEFRAAADVVADDGTPVLSLDYTLLDGDLNGAAGVAVTLSVTGYNALVLGGYAPFSYSNEAYTSDIEEAVRRVGGVDVDVMVSHILESLGNETLRRELAAEGVGFGSGSSSAERG